MPHAFDHENLSRRCDHSRRRERPRHAEAGCAGSKTESSSAGCSGSSERAIAITAAKPHRTLIAIGSGKGGVGKSTLTANLAIALARMGKRVGYRRRDIYGPSQPTLFGTSEKPQAEKEKLIPVECRGSSSCRWAAGVGGHRTRLARPMATSA
jgi:ATP-binding protein involved in chromosome partitioning